MPTIWSFVRGAGRLTPSQEHALGGRLAGIPERDYPPKYYRKKLCSLWLEDCDSSEVLDKSKSNQLIPPSFLSMLSFTLTFCACKSFLEGIVRPRNSTRRSAHCPADTAAPDRRGGRVPLFRRRQRTPPSQG